MPLIQHPSLVGRNPEQIHLILDDPQRADRALEHRGAGNVEDIIMLPQYLSCTSCLLLASVRQIDIRPARKPVLLIIFALSMPDEHDFDHGSVPPDR